MSIGRSPVAVGEDIRAEGGCRNDERSGNEARERAQRRDPGQQECGQGKQGEGGEFVGSQEGKAESGGEKSPPSTAGTRKKGDRDGECNGQADGGHGMVVEGDGEGRNERAKTGRRHG